MSNEYNFQNDDVSSEQNESELHDEEAVALRESPTRLPTSHVLLLYIYHLLITIKIKHIK